MFCMFQKCREIGDRKHYVGTSRMLDSTVKGRVGAAITAVPLGMRGTEKERTKALRAPVSAHL